MHVVAGTWLPCHPAEAGAVQNCSSELGLSFLCHLEISYNVESFHKHLHLSCVCFTKFHIVRKFVSFQTADKITSAMKHKTGRPTNLNPFWLTIMFWMVPPIERQNTREEYSFGEPKQSHATKAPCSCSQIISLFLKFYLLGLAPWPRG